MGSGLQGKLNVHIGCASESAVCNLETMKCVGEHGDQIKIEVRAGTTSNHVAITYDNSTTFIEPSNFTPNANNSLFLFPRPGFQARYTLGNVALCQDVITKVYLKPAVSIVTPASLDVSDTKQNIQLKLVFKQLNDNGTEFEGQPEEILYEGKYQLEKNGGSYFLRIEVAQAKDNAFSKYPLKIATTIKLTADEKNARQLKLKFFTVYGVRDAVQKVFLYNSSEPIISKGPSEIDLIESLRQTTFGNNAPAIAQQLVDIKKAPTLLDALKSMLVVASKKMIPKPLSQRIEEATDYNTFIIALGLNPETATIGEISIAIRRIGKKDTSTTRELEFLHFIVNNKPFESRAENIIQLMMEKDKNLSYMNALKKMALATLKTMMKNKSTPEGRSFLTEKEVKITDYDAFVRYLFPDADPDTIKIEDVRKQALLEQ